MNKQAHWGINADVVWVWSLGGPAGGPAGDGLGDAVGAEDASAVAAVVLAPVRRQGRLAVLARRHVVLVLPPDLRREEREGRLEKIK